MRSGYGHMVLDYYIEKLRRMRAERAARLSAITTKQQAQAYQARVKEAILRAFGPRPPKTPLKARVTGTIEGSEYRIEKVLFESRPGCLVTANLYVPNDLKGPAPGVVGACGHAPEGKAFSLYQGFCQRLALFGFVVLIYDPFNQGERDQYALLEDREAVTACTRAHNMMGKQLELIGENLSMWRAWDGIRALDYLLTRPEVDPQHIGLTGNSGGGTMTTWLWPIEERFTMAAPSCFVTSFLSNLENELPADCEQYPPGVLCAGLEMADFFIARAPRPVIILGQHYDYFDRRGHQEACDEIRRFYDLLDAPGENMACFRGNHPHGFFCENQEAMVEFFAHHVKDGREAAQAALRPGIAQVKRVAALPHLRAETETLEASLLYATPTGNVIQAGGKPIFELIAERADDLATERPALSPAALRERLSRLLNLPAVFSYRDTAHRPTPHHRNLRPVKVSERTYARCAIETEGNIRAILRKRMADPQRAHSLDVAKTVHLWLPHYASEEDLGNDPMALELQKEHELYALDVRGLGESLPDEGGSFWQSYGLDYMCHGHGILFGESYLGRRVLDALATIDLLTAQGAERVHLYGRGQGALIALFATLLHQKVVAVTLKNAPGSYQDWALAPLVDWPAANFIRGVLQFFDLDDCIQALGTKVTVIEPWDARMRPL